MFHRRKHPRAVYGVSKLSLLEAAHATCRDAYRQWSASPKDGDVAAELRRLKEEVATMSHTVYQVWLQVHHTEVAIADVLQNVPLAGTFAEPVDEEEPARQRRRYAAPPPAESRAAKARWAAKKISAEARQRLLKQLRGVRHTARRKFYDQLQMDATPAAPRPPRRLPERRPPAAELESPKARMMTLRTMGHSGGGGGYAPAAAPPPPSPTPVDAPNPSPSPAPPAPTGRTLRGAGAPAASPAAASSPAPPPSPSPPSPAAAATAPAPRPTLPAGQPPPASAAPPTPSAPAVVAPPPEPAPARQPPPPPQPVEDGPEFFLDTRPMTEETSRAPVLRSPVAPQPFIALTGTWTTSPMAVKSREADAAPEAPAPPAPPSILPFTAPTSISCGPFNFAAAAPGSDIPAPFQFTGAPASDALKPFVFGGGAPTAASAPGVFLFGASPATGPTAPAPAVAPAHTPAPPQADNSAPALVAGPLNFPLDPALRFSGLMEEDRPPPPPVPAPGTDAAQDVSEPPPLVPAAAAGEAPAPPSTESADAASAMDVDAEGTPLPAPSLTSAAPEPNRPGDAAPEAAAPHLARLAAPWLTVSGIAAPVLEAADHYWECRAVTVSCPTRPNWEAATICSLERTTRTGWCLQLAQVSPLGVRAPVASRPFTPGLCYCNPLPGGCVATLCDESDSSGQASCVVVFNFGKAADCEAFVGFLSQRLDPFVIRSSLPPFQVLKPPPPAASPVLPSPPAIPLAPHPSPSPSPSPASPEAEAVPSPEFVLLTGPTGPEKSAWVERYCPSVPGRTLTFLSVPKSDKATSWPRVVEQVTEKLREGQAVVVDVEDLGEEEARALAARLPPGRRRVKHVGPPPPGVAELLQGCGFDAEL